MSPQGQKPITRESNAIRRDLSCQSPSHGGQTVVPVAKTPQHGASLKHTQTQPSGGDSHTYSEASPGVGTAGGGGPGMGDPIWVWGMAQRGSLKWGMGEGPQWEM